MTQPTNGDVPEAGGAPDSDATQSIQQQHTEAVPTYSYPTTSQAADGADGAPAPAAPGAPAAPAAPAAGVALDDDPSAPTRSKRTGLLVGGLAALLVLGGGGLFAAQKLSGSGAQPADVLPGDSFFYARLDIDPSAGQKIAAVRFLGKLPEVKAFESGDARKKLWEMISKDAGDDCVSKFGYDKDIAPWIGERAGLAMRPGGTSDEPNVAIALQVTDEGKAKDTLTKLIACDSGDKADLRMKDGYALITPPGKGDATVAAAEKGSLAASASFKDDMGALGEQGIASMWMDLPTMLKEAKNLGGSDTASLGALPASFKGRVAAALRFDPAYIELAGVVRGADASVAVPAGDGAELANLPDDTAAAIHVANLDQNIGTAWPQLEKQIKNMASADGQDDPIAMIEQQFDVKLPDDLKVLLGKSFTLAMPVPDTSAEMPTIGAKVVSSDAARADEIITKIEDAAGASGVLTHKVDGSKLYVTTTPEYADKLKSGGKLGDSEAFKAALGDVSKTSAAVYVDLDKLEKLYLSDMDGKAREVVEAMKAAGFTVSNTGAGEGSFSLRLVGN